MQNINDKKVRLYDESTGQAGEQISTYSRPSDITFDNGQNLPEVLENILDSLEEKSENSHTHTVDNIEGLLQKFLDLDKKYASKTEIENATHTHDNMDILDLIDQDLLDELNDKYTQVEVDRIIQNLEAVIKNKYSQKGHTHSINDLTDYRPPSVPTKISQLSNDKNFITLQDLKDSGIINNVQGSHTHNNKAILDTITKAMLDNFADKYTKDEIDTMISTGGGGGDLSSITELLKNKAAKVHTHEISEINLLESTLKEKANSIHNHELDDIDGLDEKLHQYAPVVHTHKASEIDGLDNHNHTNKSVLDRMSDAQLQKIEDSASKEELNNNITYLDTKKAEVSHRHYMDEIDDINSIMTLQGEWINNKAPFDYSSYLTNCDSYYNPDEETIYIRKGAAMIKYDCSLETILIDEEDDSIIVWTVPSAEDLGKTDYGFVADSSRIYFIGGINSDGSYSNEITVYNCDSEEFEEPIIIPEAIANPGVLISGNDIYIVGGKYINVDTGNEEIYGKIMTINLESEDVPIINSYTFDTNSLSPSLLYEGDTIYAVGGRSKSGGYVNSITGFDIIQHKTTLREKLLYSVYNPFIVMSYGHIYVIGGSISGGPINKCQRFNINSLESELFDELNVANGNPIGYKVGENKFVILHPNSIDIYNGDVKVINPLPTGLQGQIPFLTTNGKNTVMNDYILKKVNIVDNGDELKNAQEVVISFADVFSTWKRFSHDNTTNQPANETELTSWKYDSVNDKVMCTINSVTYIGFVSKEKYDNYIHEVTLSSTDADDDFIGVVIAFATDSNGVEHTLSAIRNRSGKPMWMIVYDYKRTSEWIINRIQKIDGDDIDYDNGAVTNTELTGWDNIPNGARVKIERNGNIIKAWTTKYNDNSNAYVESSLLSVNLTSDERLSIFMGPSSYGYSCMSQIASQFTNIKFVGGGDDVIYDASTGNVYKKINNVWSVDTTKNIINEIGIGHFAFNETTGKLFYVNEAKEIKCVSGNYNNLEVGQYIKIHNDNYGEFCGIYGGKQNDGWRIGFGMEQDDQGYLELGTCDNGNEPIYVTQYIGTAPNQVSNPEDSFRTIVKRMTLLDYNGNTVVNGLKIGDQTLEEYIKAILKSLGLIS